MYDDVDRLIDQLRDPLRPGLEAAWALEKIGKPAVEPLIKALGDRDWNVRYYAAMTLGDIGDKRAVEPLIKALGDKDSWVREYAAEALGKIGKPAVEPLIKTLGDGEKYVRENAAEALGKIGKPAVEPLIKALGDRNEDLRYYAARVLGEIGDKRAVEPLIKALGDEYSLIRGNAAEALGKIRDPRAVRPLIKALGDGDWNVRYYATLALGEIGDKRAVEPLIKALGDKDEDASVRYYAAFALGKIGDKRAVEPLIKILGNGLAKVRRDAAEALGNTGDKRAVEPLIKALEDEDELVRGFAAWALAKIGDPRMFEPLIKALGNGNAKVRRDAAEALGNIGNKRAVKPLIKALGDRDWRVRKNAALALGNIGNKRAVKPLIKALGDEDEDVRKNAAEALKKTGWYPDTDEQKALYLVALQEWDKAVKLGEPAVKPLIKALGDEDVRKNAAGALVKIGEPAVEPLIKALGDKDGEVRKNAAEALKKTGWYPDTDEQKALYLVALQEWDKAVKLGEPAVAPLIKILGDGNKDVRKNAALALENIGDLAPDARILSPLKRYYKSEFSGIFKGRKVKKALSPFVSVLVPALQEQYSHWPHLFCDSCLLRPVEKKLKLGWFKSQKYGQCPGCGTSLLVPGITEVIGVIGGEEGNRQSGSSYIVQLLDREDESIRYADIDRLEIRPVEGMNYDAVINKAVLVLCDNSSRPLKYWKNLPVYIQGVDLSQNAQNMLKQNFGMVTVEA